MTRETKTKRTKTKTVNHARRKRMIPQRPGYRPRRTASSSSSWNSVAQDRHFRAIPQSLSSSLPYPLPCVAVVYVYD